MSALVLLIPVALILGFMGLVAFIWALTRGQFEDPDGAAARILHDAPPTPKAKPAKAPRKVKNHPQTRKKK